MDAGKPAEPQADHPPADIPDLPWRTPAKAGEPRVPLTREAVVDAAVRVMDREGMDGLSMRHVGEELGTGAASLYWHVRNKEHLLQLVFERVTDELELPEPDPSRWQEQLKDLGRQMLGVMRRHRDVARISLGRIPAGPTLARFTEWLFALLQPVGIPDRVIAYLGDFMSLYIAAYGFEESLGVISPTGEEMAPEEIVRMLAEYTRSLPEDRFPRTRAAADELFSGSPAERFEFALDLVIRGLETHATGSA
ncbi:MAG TPA: TetR/AcrR family transcriptional regulator [Actinomycetota bacterium]|nr:TetR/AcrR family transcriptional regulator [Actinomycetota bacterium]